MRFRRVKGINRNRSALSLSVESPQPDQPENEEANTSDQQPELHARPEPPEQGAKHDAEDDHLHEHAQVRSRQQQVDQQIHRMSKQHLTDTSSRHPLEVILAIGLRRLLAWGIPLGALGLLLRAPGPDQSLWAYSLIHLAIVQAASFSFTIEMAGLTDHPWFAHLRRPWLASVASLVAAVVGFSALLTLATSAAARYDVSLQFLQLLSSLDIAWVVAALYLGSRRLSNPQMATIAGSVLLVACVASIAVYLSVVGFTPDGGWLVDGGELIRIVLPSDTVAAVISLTAILLASRRDQPMEQARLQS